MNGSRRDWGVSTRPNFGKTYLQTGQLETSWNPYMSQLPRLYRAPIVIITNIIGYYYSCDRWDCIFINLLLLGIGGSIAGIWVCLSVTPSRLSQLSQLSHLMKFTKEA
jgi:hypothetical protein